MKFINPQLIPVGWNNDNLLLFSYVGKIKASVKIDCIVESNEIFFIGITYTISFKTENKEPLTKSIFEYNSNIENDGLYIDKDRLIIREHVKTGLILALNVASGNDPSYATALLASVNLKWKVEKVLIELSRLDFY